MSNIFVEPDKINNSAGELESCGTTIRSLSDKLKDVNNNLGIMGSQSSQIRAALNGINQSLLDDAAKASSFHGALLKIANAYKQNEKEILGMSSGILTGSKDMQDVAGSGEFGYINSFSRLIETLELISRYWDDEEKLNEAIHDRYMSYSAQDLLKKTAYSEETWNKASLEERKEMLVSFLAELNALMGINVAYCEFSHLKESTRGQYSNKKNIVRINLDYIDPAKENSDSYKIMRTMIHEMRHAYQKAVVDHPDQYKVSAETRQQWADNFNDYKDPYKDGYDAYVEQPIEYDAKSFAGQYNDIKGHTPTYAGTW